MIDLNIFEIQLNQSVCCFFSPIRVVQGNSASWIDTEWLGPSEDAKQQVKFFAPWSGWFVEADKIVLIPCPVLGLTDPPLPDGTAAEAISAPVLHISVEKFASLASGMKEFDGDKKEDSAAPACASSNIHIKD